MVVLCLCRITQQITIAPTLESTTHPPSILEKMKIANSNSNIQKNSTRRWSAPVLVFLSFGSPPAASLSTPTLASVPSALSIDTMDRYQSSIADRYKRRSPRWYRTNGFSSSFASRSPWGLILRLSQGLQRRLPAGRSCVPKLLPCELIADCLTS